MTTDFPAPDVHRLFPQLAPLVGAQGLRTVRGAQGGVITAEPSEPVMEWRTAGDAVGGGEFRGCWAPSRIDSTHIKLTGGTFTCGTIFTPSVSSVSVHASSLNYVYLRATLSPSYVDGYVSGGGATAATVLSSTTTLTSDNTYGYILLCTWQAGAVVNRYEFFSLKARLNNANVGDVVFEHGMA